MLRNKSTKRVSEIQEDFTLNSITIDKMMGVFKSMKLTEQFSAFAAIKEKGYSFKFVMSMLIMMVVIGKRQ